MLTNTKKPAYRGSLDAGSVEEPDYWQNLIGLIPFWEGSGTQVVDLKANSHTKRLRPSVGSTSWKPSPFGTVLHNSSTGTSDRVSWDSISDRINVDMGSFLVVYRFVAVSGGSLQGIFEAGPSSSSAYFIGIRKPTDDSVVFRYRASSLNYDVTLQSSADTAWHAAVGVWGADNRVDGFFDGVKQSGATRAANAGSGINTVSLLNDGSSGVNSPGNLQIALAAAWDRPLSDTEALRLSVDPFALIRPRMWGPELLAAPAGVSGSGAITEASDTVAGSGAVAVAGSGAISEAADTVAGTGSLSYVGSGAIVELVDTVAGSGGVQVSGTGAITEAADTVVGVSVIAPRYSEYGLTAAAKSFGLAAAFKESKLE